MSLREAYWIVLWNLRQHQSERPRRTSAKPTTPHRRWVWLLIAWEHCERAKLAVGLWTVPPFLVVGWGGEVRHHHKIACAHVPQVLELGNYNGELLADAIWRHQELSGWDLKCVAGLEEFVPVRRCMIGSLVGM